MKETRKRNVFLVILLAVVCAGVFADERVDNVDMFVVLDKSLSMEEEIEAVKDYVIDILIKGEEAEDGSLQSNGLIEGDSIHIIAFYGEADRIIAESYSVAEKDKIVSAIKRINADGAFTDIGNALDELKEWLAEASSVSGRRRFMILLTDGKQEAPLDSVYFSDDGIFNHEYLENVKTFKRKGWFIHVLGIGRDSDARAIAQSLSASHEIVDTDSLNADSSGGESGSISFSGRQVFASATVIGPVIVKTIKGSGGAVSVKVKVDNASKALDVVVSDIVFETEGKTYSLLTEETMYTLDPEGENELIFEIEKGSLSPGKYTGELSFEFDSMYAFSPASSTQDIKVNSFFENNWWWIIGICILAVLLILFIIRTIRTILGKRDDEPKKKVSLM